MEKKRKLVIHDNNLQTRIRKSMLLLSQLTSHQVACAFYLKHKNYKIIAAHGGGDLNKNYNDWKFKIHNTDLWFRYHELWGPISKKNDKWYLEKAYFTLLLTNRETQSLDEVLSIHCEPEDTEYDYPKYKQIPHLHIKKSEDPLPKCHFPLKLGYLDEIMKSENTFDNSLSEIFELIKCEVINRYLSSKQRTHKNACIL